MLEHVFKWLFWGVLCIFQVELFLALSLDAEWYIRLAMALLAIGFETAKILLFTRGLRERAKGLVLIALACTVFSLVAPVVVALRGVQQQVQVQNTTTRDDALLREEYDTAKRQVAILQERMAQMPIEWSTATMRAEIATWQERVDALRQELTTEPASGTEQHMAETESFLEIARLLGLEPTLFATWFLLIRAVLMEIVVLAFCRALVRQKQPVATGTPGQVRGVIHLFQGNRAKCGLVVRQPEAISNGTPCPKCFS